MTDSARELLHIFAISYEVESAESRKICIDKALAELRKMVEGLRKNTYPIRNDFIDYEQAYNDAITDVLALLK